MANKSILAAFERMWQHTIVALGNKSDMGHSHGDLYYTEAEVDTKLTDITATTASIIDSTVKTATGSKMDKSNPTGTGSFSLNRMEDSIIGNYSFAEGCETEASGYASHAEGEYTSASNYNAHAEGFGTLASGEVSHAEGYHAVASGFASHAEGCDTVAENPYAHAEGYGTHATGYYSHAEGRNTMAQSTNQHVQGKFNLVDYNDTYAHIVGNGTANNKRSNAHTLDWSGNAWFKGDVRIGGTKYDDASIVATKAYVDSKETTTKAYVDSKEVTLKGYTDSKVETLKEYVDSKEVIVPQSDWNETDETSLAYILNKPKINKDSIILADQINGYDYII